MKNNRRNRKRVKMYFLHMNRRHGLPKELWIVPTMLYWRKGRQFAALIGDVNNPRSEIMTRSPRSTYG